MYFTSTGGPGGATWGSGTGRDKLARRRQLVAKVKLLANLPRDIIGPIPFKKSVLADMWETVQSVAILIAAVPTAVVSMLVRRLWSNQVDIPFKEDLRRSVIRR